MALTTEQQTSHLSRLQQEVLSWDYFTMDDGQTRSDAARKRALRDVPNTFDSVNEYLDVFEPLVLEECAAQISRGGDEDEEMRPGGDATIGAVFSSQRVDGFHVVRFILGEEAMAGFHDNDVVLVSKTDPNDGFSPETRARDSNGVSRDDDAKTNATFGTAMDPSEGLHHVHALGYVDGRDSRNMMRVRFFLPEPSLKGSATAAKGDGGATDPKRRGGTAAAKKDAPRGKQKDGASEDDFARFRAVRNALASPKSAWYLTHLANMSTIAREWLALRAFPSLPFAHAILGGKVDAAPRGSKPGGNKSERFEEHAPWELPEPLAAAMKRAYNASQLRAVSAALEKQPITLIQGPPGTGKTRIVLSLLSAILHAAPGSAGAFGHETDLKKFLERRERAPRRKVDAATVAKNHKLVSPWMRGAANPRDAPPDAKPLDAAMSARGEYSFQRPETPEIVGESAKRRTKVLVCAPSNAALDEIVMRIMYSGLLGPDGNAYSPTLVRVGVNAHRGVEKVSMETLVRERVGSFDDADEDGVLASEKKFERALERDRVKLAILDEASVVCSTLSFSGSGMFARMTKKFDVVVVDEAAQAVEPSTLVPLCYGATQAFLVGDPRQLPATVLSSAATQKGYARSLFKRFEECGHPVHLLRTQYRMHPEIRRFPSGAFYGDALEDGPGMRKRARRPWHANALFRPFVFFDVEGTERQGSGASRDGNGGGCSWANDDEARFAAALVKRLVADYPSLLNEDETSGAGVGVISPYKAQVKAIRRALERALGPERARLIDVNSVDGFQGREKEVCVFSVTRAPKVVGNKGKKDEKSDETAPSRRRGKNLLGFVADERRVNVGLTRARASLLVVGSAKALQTDANWGALVRSATERRLLVRPSGGRTAAAFDAFVAKHSAAYEADDLSGDEDEAFVDEATERDDLVASSDPSGDGDDDVVLDARKKHVHKPEWSGAVGLPAAERRGGKKTAVAKTADSDDDALGFAVDGARDELVTEASNVRGVGQADDYAAGNDEDDGDLDAFAQAPEPAGEKKRAAAKRAPPRAKRAADASNADAPPKRPRGKR